MNEIQYSATLQASKGGATVSKSASAALTQTGDDSLQQTQDITTAGAQLDFGNITGAPAKLLIINLDATNYITLYGDSGFTQAQDKILPQDFILRSPSSGSLWAKANTATCKIQIVAAEA